MTGSIKLGATGKIGDWPAGQSKYSAFSDKSGYYRRMPTAPTPFKSDKQFSGSYTLDELKSNVKVCSTLRQENKSKVEVKRSTQLKAKEFSKTQFTQSFFDQRNWSKVLLKYECSSFVDEFNAHVARGGPLVGEGNDAMVLVAPKYIAAIITKSLGSDTPEFIVDKFSILSTKYSVDKTISWATFESEVYPKVINAIQAECQFRRELPALLQLMNRPRIVDKNIGPLGDMTTNYRDFFNKEKEISFADSASLTYSPNMLSEGLETIELNRAAKALCAGTIKGTARIPGFKGHMPRNTSNSIKYKHSVGTIEHPVDNNLRLTQRGMGAVLGYTGHIPHVIKGGNKERMTGMDPSTSNGAAYGPVRVYL